MKVSKLIEKLQALPQDSIVVLPAFDHSYRPINNADAAQADHSNWQWSEWDEDCGYEPQGEIVKVVVIE